ncbi:hypothetical protein LQW54_008182 [Pestalotiopsis sp. IQ-011]
MFKYNGPVMIDRKASSLVNDNLTAKMFDGQVILDFASYFKYGPTYQRLGEPKLDVDGLGCACEFCASGEDLRKALPTGFDFKMETADDWHEEQLMLCPPRVPGYIPRDKGWAQLLVDGIGELPEVGEVNAFNDELVLPEGSRGLSFKSTLLGLVKGHNAFEGESIHRFKDNVMSSSPGLIILPHENILTTWIAETLAIAARKPLIPIGVADVGTSAKDIEKNLETIFDLAQKWKAILLIDEIDAFVQSRGSGNVGATTERNALTSVFLRVIESYRGIMILTSNQIHTLDYAVQSRISIGFRFNSLSPKQITEISKKLPTAV